MTPERIKELARLSLDERWIPRSKAQTWKEVDDVPDCRFCKEPPDPAFCQDKGCPLYIKWKKRPPQCCGGLWNKFDRAITVEDARAAAKKIVKMLEGLL